MRRVAVCFLPLLCSAACDPKAVPADHAANPAVLSTDGESCAATADCAQGLRCIDARCAPAQSSRVGDFRWATGRLALAKGDANAASEELQRAVSQYETDKLAPPAALLCDYGAALRRKKGDAKASEQAARFLHRCVLAAPPGGALYTTGMTELAQLEEVGLDPALLARSEPADAYLTRAAHPTGPAQVTVTESNPARDKGYTAYAQLLRDKGTPIFQKCAEGQPGAVEVSLSLKYRQSLGDDDIVEGAKLDVSGTAAAGAASCIKDAATQLATEFQKDLRASSGSWNGDVTVKVAPPG
jgi:hypothetical protein